ncbi:hypothetical protein L7F22_038176 [Adiantum nelumboides]|nr:hypothetical protein [Adiantum nelumboides]
MKDEIDSLQKNNTWTLVPLPPARKPISCKWVLRRKLHPDGSVARYKARLVARGFSQIAGLDYGDTFSPVLRMSSFRLLLALAATLDLEIFHLDVQTAFLHGELPEELYIEQPPYFVSETAPHSVCRLHRSLYGLKQSPRLWFHNFNAFMLSHGYQRLHSEPNVYTRHTRDSILVVALYVDDIPMLGSSREVIDYAFITSRAAFGMADNNIDVFKMFAAKDKLDGDNYPMWAYMMQHVLVSKGGWNIVKGIDVPPGSVDDAQAHALIALSMKRTITSHIRSTKSAKQAWDILAGLYAGRNEAKIALLRKELESKIMNVMEFA